MKQFIINIYHKIYFLWYYRSTFFKKYKQVGKSVIIYSAIPYMYITPFEILIYHILKRKGYNVTYLIYPKEVFAAEILTKNVKNKNNLWTKIFKNGTRLLYLANVKYEKINLSNNSLNIFLKIKNINDIKQLLSLTFEEINFGNIVLNSLCRYYKSTNYKLFEIDVIKSFLKTSILNYLEIKNRSKSRLPDLVLMSHGIYITWESVRLFCKNNNIKHVCYDRGKMMNSININFNNESPNWEFNNYWNEVNNLPLNDIKFQKVTKYLNERISQKNDVFSYNPLPKIDDINKLKKTIGIKDNQIVITLFTNLIWDAANTTRDLAFNSMKECIVKTIDKYSENNKYYIIIRPHPAENVLGTNETYENIILKHYKNKLPSNVTILNTSNSINSFDVIEITDIAVVNTSTIGIEVVINGKNVILISKTNYRDKGFTIDVQNEDEYFNQIAELSNIENLKATNSKKEKALKYFYILMFEYQKIIPLEYKKQLFIKYSLDFNNIIKDKMIESIINNIEDPNKIDFMPNSNEF